MKSFKYAAIAMFIMAMPALAQQNVDQKRPAKKDGIVQVFNLAGSVRITAWDREEIAVKGTLGKGVERLEFSGSNGRTLIKVVIPTRTHESADAQLEIQVPAGSRLDVETVSAEIDVRDVTGEARLVSTSGRIDMTGATSSFYAKTVSGNIEISAEKAPGRAEAISGSITLSGVAGSVEATTVSGYLDVSGSDISTAEMETTSGDIRFSGDLRKNARLDGRTVSGSVNISLPADVSAEFDVSTFSGSISSDFGAASKSGSRFGSGAELEFSTGKAARVVVNTFSGSVHIIKK